MKKTIEEAAEEYGRYNYDTSTLDITDHFIAGAKYQSKQMYSEDEVDQYLFEVIVYDYKGRIKLWKESKK